MKSRPGALTRRSFLHSSVGLAAVNWKRPQLTRSSRREQIPRFLLDWGREGSKEGEFRSPVGIAIGSTDDILVTDLHNARIQKFGPGGEFMATVDLPRDLITSTSRGSSAGGIAVNQQGIIYVSLMTSHAVLVLDAGGRQLLRWGKQGSGEGEFNEPGGIALAPDGTVYVADQTNRRVQQFTPQGVFLNSWGEHGSRLGQFDGVEPLNSRFGGPHFLAVDSSGHIYTTEGALARVQKFSAAGHPVLSWGDKSDEHGGFGSLQTVFSRRNTLGPIGICTDNQDNVWVSSLNNRVQQFTADGEYLGGIGRGGAGPGEFRFPHAMAADSRNHLYVVDSGNHRVQKFEIPLRNV